MDINLYSKNNPPPIESIKNNGKILDLKCLGFLYQRHLTNKKSWNYRCAECSASISVKLVENVPIIPYEVTYLSIVHTHEAYDDSISIEREFIDKVGLLVRDQPHTPIQQISGIRRHYVFQDNGDVEIPFQVLRNEKLVKLKNKLNLD
jgi:hypothetical protein